MYNGEELHLTLAKWSADQAMVSTGWTMEEMAICGVRIDVIHNPARNPEHFRLLDISISFSGVIVTSWGGARTDSYINDFLLSFKKDN